MKTLKETIKKFSQNFHLHHDSPEDFCISQWQWNSKSLRYVIYRWIVAFLFVSFMVGWFIGDFINGTGIIIDFIYLTNLSFLLSTVTMTISACLATLHYKKSDSCTTSEMTTILKLFWILSTISTTIAVAVSVNYWMLVHDPEKHAIDFNNIVSHLMNVLVLLIDLCVIKQPGKFSFFIFPTSYGAVYLSFTWIYAISGGLDKYVLLKISKIH